MVSPSGEQYEMAAAGYRAVVTESGAALRVLEHEGQPLIDGFGVDAMAPGGRGQLLMPWPNRIRDGRYSSSGRSLQLPLTEPGRHNASHGLVRWVAWSLVEQRPGAVTLGYRLMAQTGYPWTLAVRVEYSLTEEGLTVTQSATNLTEGPTADPAPYAQGAHPYLTVGPGPVDTWELTLPASTRGRSDPDRKLPTGREPVVGTPYDFRVGRPVGDVVLDHAFTDLARDDAGRATVVVRDATTGHGVELWTDENWPWVMVYSADDQSDPRRALAVEPMTANADAFRSGEDLHLLSPAGRPGDTFAASWGIRVLS